MEPYDFDADSDDEDAFENIILEANAAKSIINRINQQSMADLLKKMQRSSFFRMRQYRLIKCSIVELRLMATHLVRLLRINI
jgi:hypothetical protein